VSVLLGRVKAAIEAERVLVSTHADDSLRERSITAWQVVMGARDGGPPAIRPRAKPNPVVEPERRLADGTPVKAVWAHISSIDAATLVTVHFFDR
jgi:hypothetical protein